MNCPICNGKTQSKKVPYTHNGVEFGAYDADVCTHCDEVFFTEKSSDAIDKRAKALGLWGRKPPAS